MMDKTHIHKIESVNTNGFLIMDNDSGYVSNNLDQESNSNSLSENLDTSTVEILKSFIPKPVYLSEDALLECPNLQQELHTESMSENLNDSLDIVIEPSVLSEKSFPRFPSFSSFQGDSDISISPTTNTTTDPIYFDLNLKSSTVTKEDDEKVSDENDFKGFDEYSNDRSTQAFEKISSFNSSLQEKDEKLILDNSPSVLKYKCSTPLKVQSKSNSDNILSNVTNTCEIPEKLISETFKINNKKCTHSSKDKENILNPEHFKTPNKSSKNKFSESLSPDLFSDDDTINQSLSPKILEEKYVHKLDKRLLKRVQKELSGVPPPPDFTITHFTVDDILQKLEENKSLFWSSGDTSNNEQKQNSSAGLNESKNSSFLYSTSVLIEGNFEEVSNKKFPDILYSRHHGLHHNRNKLSEEIEHLCDKYAKRYVGAETQSTCCAVETKYSSPSKRKSIKQKWLTKSPGRRLSHLAKRRITFSSANLQASSSSSATSRARQILIDYRKLEPVNHKRSPRKSPRKTPRKSPTKSPNLSRTPSSSAKKKLRMRFRLLSGDFKEGTSASNTNIQGSKRALFQSPEKDKFRNILSNSSSSSFNSDILNKNSTKRSLFSPNKMGFKSSLLSSPKKKSPFKNISGFEKKRKRDDTDDGTSNPNKLFKSQSFDAKPLMEVQLNSKIKNENLPSSSQTLTDLSAPHKKKLQWAVYESLKLQNINTTHPQFKTFASVLARVTRRFIVTSNIRMEGGTSERMLRIAKHYSFAVVKGKSVEEIMNEYNKNKAKISKPQGYIAPDDVKAQNKETVSNRDTVLKDRSNTGDFSRSSNSRPNNVKIVSRIDRIRKVINFEDNR